MWEVAAGFVLRLTTHPTFLMPLPVGIFDHSLSVIKKKETKTIGQELSGPNWLGTNVEDVFIQHRLLGVEWFRSAFNKQVFLVSFRVIIVWFSAESASVLCFFHATVYCVHSEALNISNLINTWLHSAERPRPALNLLPWGMRVCTFLSKRLLQREWLTLGMYLAKSQGLFPAFRLCCCRRLFCHWKASSRFHLPKEFYFLQTVAPLQLFFFWKRRDCSIWRLD